MFIASVSQTARIVYHVHFCLSRTFFIFWSKFFWNSFWSDVSLIEATCISYHNVFRLSTIIFSFFKTFWIVYSLKTISCDSSIRIPLSSSPVNTFFIFLKNIQDPRMGDVFVRLNQKTVAGYWLAIWETPGIDIEQQISQIVLDS